MSLNQYGPVTVQESEYAQRWRYTTSGCAASGSTSLQQTAGPYVKSYSSRNARGFDIPGWRRMRNAGALLPFTEWDRFEIEGSAVPAERVYCGGPTEWRNYWVNFYRGGSFIAKEQGELMALVDPFDLQYLVQKAAAQIYSGGWDALTFLAELRQLRRMFSGISEKLEKLSRGQSPGKLHDLWLEGRYGWRTLMYDIRDLHEVLLTANERRTRRRHRAGLTVSGAWSNYNESSSSGIVEGTSQVISWTGNLRGTVVADIDVPKLQFNPVTTAWEVTRLSFVVDWLWNVGQGLDAASFLLMAKDYKAGVGYRFDFDLSHDISLVDTYGGAICYANTGHADAKAFVIRREPSTVSAIPRLQLRMDKWKALDLLSLFIQRI